MTGKSRIDQLLQSTVRGLSVVDVDQFFGIEIGEFPALIAEVAMWMMDHIMNNKLSLEFGRIFRRIPLKKSPTILHENALRTNWRTSPAVGMQFLFGNPPFVGHQYRDAEQVRDMRSVWGNAGRFNRLDYVTCWFLRALEYASSARHIRIGFVATNSICQGEQAEIWPRMFSLGVSISFAHRTFQWTSEARGRAAVHCVIVGYSLEPPATRTIFDYQRATGEPTAVQVRNINGYLIDGPNITIESRASPQLGQLEMMKGSQPTDGARIRLPEGGYQTFSNLILDEDEAAQAPRCRAGGGTMVAAICWGRGVDLWRMALVSLAKGH